MGPTYLQQTRYGKYIRASERPENQALRRLPEEHKRCVVIQVATSSAKGKAGIKKLAQARAVHRMLAQA